MKRRLFTLINRARHDLQQAEKELACPDDDMPDEDFEQELFEARARVLALEARVEAIEQRSNDE